MKKTAFILSLFILLVNCSNSVKKENKLISNSLENDAIKIVLADTSSKETLIKSHLLLSHLILSDSQLESLKSPMLKMKTDSIKYLLMNYQLWNQTQEIKYQKSFIDYYPTGNNLLLLNKSIENCNYRLAASPLQKTLAQFATDEPEALTKLINSIPYVDGANADELSNQLDYIKNINKDLFSATCNKLKINEEDIIINK